MADIFCPGAAYTASKHGLIGLTKNTAAFYGKKGVRCVAVLPGTNFPLHNFPNPNYQITQVACKLILATTLPMG